VQCVEALLVRLVQLADLGQEGVGILELVEDVGQQPLVGLRGEEFLGDAPELRKPGVGVHGLSGVVDHQDAVAGGFDGGPEHLVGGPELLGGPLAIRDVAVDRHHGGLAPELDHLE
jgi:hypothetical protein